MAIVKIPDGGGDPPPPFTRLGEISANFPKTPCFTRVFCPLRRVGGLPTTLERFGFCSLRSRKSGFACHTRRLRADGHTVVPHSDETL